MSRADLQLTLNLFARTAHVFATFESGRNTEALRAVESWARGDGPAVVLLWGGLGSGKSHLLQAAIEAHGRAGRRAMYVPLRELSSSGPGVLEALDAVGALAIDDLDVGAGDVDWETRLFHLYNAMQAAGGRLLLSTTRLPVNCGFSLDDLVSRLNAALIYQLHALDDTGKRRVLAALASHRGIELPDAVANYILSREDRDLGTLVALLTRLDEAALSQQRPLTVPLVREVLARPA